MNAQDLEGLMQGQRDELAAWRDICLAAPPGWAQAHGLAWAERGGALALALRDLPAGLFNRVFGLGDPAPATQDDIAWACGASPYHGPWLQPTPGPHEGASIAALQAQGLQPLPMRWAKLMRPLDQAALAVPATPFEVRELGAHEGGLFGQTLQAAMGLPPWMAEWSPGLAGRPGWHLYVAQDAAGRAIGCAALFMHGRGAWLGMAATRAEARNQGVQRTLMWRRLRDAQQRGALTATTETGEPMPGQQRASFDNMLACGLRVCAYRTSWARPKAAAGNS